MVKTILDIPSSVGNFTGEHRIWSASTLKEVEECPKRFALRRASFPEIWSRTGFPNRISTAQVKGIVVHEVVSKIMNSLQNSSELPEISVLTFLKERGGYLELLKITLEKELLSVSSNPRARLMVESIKQEILSDLSEAITAPTTWPVTPGILLSKVVMIWRSPGRAAPLWVPPFSTKFR